MQDTKRCIGNGRHVGRLAQRLVHTLAESQVEVEAETLGDILKYAQPLVDTLADLGKQWSTRWLSRKQKWRKRRYATQ